MTEQEPRDSGGDRTTGGGGRVAVRVGVARLHHDLERLPDRAERFLGLLDRSRTHRPHPRSPGRIELTDAS